MGTGQRPCLSQRKKNKATFITHRLTMSIIKCAVDLAGSYLVNSLASWKKKAV
jgi:hypothetical protein